MDKLSSLNVIEKLAGDSNWTSWKFDVLLQFTPSNRGKSIIDGDLVAPVALAAGASQEDRKKFEEDKKVYENADSLVRQVIGCTVKPDVKQHILACTTGKDMWDTLLSVYEQKNERRLDLLYGKLFNYVKDPLDNVAVHVSKLQNIWTDLGVALKDENVVLPQSMLLNRVLNTLPADFLEFKNAWESTVAADRTLCEAD